MAIDAQRIVNQENQPFDIHTLVCTCRVQKSPYELFVSHREITKRRV